MTLNVTDLQSGYNMLPVLHGASCRVESGELVSLFGPNGAGKTTLARAIFGEIPVHAGSLTYRESDISTLSVEKRTDLKMSYVPQENSTFPDLTVEENIRVGLTTQKRSDISQRIQYAYELFPVLGERRHQGANTLSGGERKMLSLASVVVLGSDFLLIDEPTSGLAPIVVDGLIEKTVEIAKSGITVFWIVGDDANKILPLADRRYLMKSGLIVGEWDKQQQLTSEELAELYFQTD